MKGTFVMQWSSEVRDAIQCEPPRNILQIKWATRPPEIERVTANTMPFTNAWWRSTATRRRPMDTGGQPRDPSERLAGSILRTDRAKPKKEIGYRNVYPRWRCVVFDALAVRGVGAFAIFVARRGSNVSSSSVRSAPCLTFLASADSGDSAALSDVASASRLELASCSGYSTLCPFSSCWTPIKGETFQ